MNKHRISWIVACIAVMPTAMLLLGQAPSTPIMREPDRPVLEAQESKIRKYVFSVNVPVTVMNAKGELVSNLEAKDFRVTDNGVPQKIMYLDLGPTPLSMVFLVETSSRIEPLLTEMRKTGIIFADALMGPNDEAAVVGFNDSVDNLADFTNDHDVILTAISNLKCGMERSKLFDAMATGVNLLSTHLRRQSVAALTERRLVIVAMSEATDVGSDERLESVVRRAQLFNISVYSVGIPTTLAQLKALPKDVRHTITPEGMFPQPGIAGNVQIPPSEDIRYGYGNIMNLNVWAARNVKDQITGHALQIAAAQTGGRHIATFGGITMQKAVDEIGGELHTQHTLTYEPKGTDRTGYHKIKVYVKNKDLKVRARPGYYIAPPQN
jgi:VWFA-related protein